MYRAVKDENLFAILDYFRQVLFVYLFPTREALERNRVISLELSFLGNVAKKCHLPLSRYKVHVI